MRKWVCHPKTKKQRNKLNEPRRESDFFAQKYSELLVICLVASSVKQDIYLIQKNQKVIPRTVILALCWMSQ